MYAEHQRSVFENRKAAFYALLDEVSGKRLDVTFDELLPQLESDPRYTRLTSVDTQAFARSLFDQYLARRVRAGADQLTVKDPAALTLCAAARTRAGAADSRRQGGLPGAPA